MKNILLSLLCFLFAGYSVFANSQIDIGVSERNLQVGERFMLTIELSDIITQGQGGEISIPGIENFNVFAQNISEQIQNINGETQSITQFQITLSPKYVGDFELGPISLGNEESLIDNEKISIIVSDTTQRVSVAAAEPQDNGTGSDIDTQAILENMSQGKLGVLRIVGFPVWGHIAILVFFIGVFYLLLSYIFKTEKKPIQKGEVTPIIQDQNKKYKKYFQNLSGKIGTLTSEEFFQQYNIGVRDIFTNAGVTKAQTLTLSEITKQKDILSCEIFNLFIKSYKHEYSKVDVSSATQKKYIENIILALS